MCHPHVHPNVSEHRAVSDGTSFLGAERGRGQTMTTSSRGGCRTVAIVIGMIIFGVAVLTRISAQKV